MGAWESMHCLSPVNAATIVQAHPSSAGVKDGAGAKIRGKQPAVKASSIDA